MEITPKKLIMLTDLQPNVPIETLYIPKTSKFIYTGVYLYGTNLSVFSLVKRPIDWSKLELPGNV